MRLQILPLAVADSLADWSGFLRRPLSADRLMEAACRRTGLADFGLTPIAEPLQRLLESCQIEASLGLVGRFALHWDALRFLSNLLRFRFAERREPEILRRSIEAPIVITGLPRSGTTFLHQMMLCDPANRAPLVWETIYPYPDARRPRAKDTRQVQVERQLRTFALLAPEFRNLHRLAATSPQECTEITGHAFRSLRFDTTYRIPSYRAWLETDAAGHLPAYQLHKRFLQHLQHRDAARDLRQRWVLKCPDHLFALAALRAVYPDARLVFVHRDPVRVLLSVAKLTEVLRRPFSRHVNRIEIGRQERERWLDGAERMIAASDDPEWKQPICHVHYLDLVSDPARTVGSVYRHFGTILPEAVAAAIAWASTAQPNGGYGSSYRCRFEEYGIDAAAEREKFRPYMRYFGVTQELAAELRNTALRKPPVSSRPSILST